MKYIISILFFLLITNCYSQIYLTNYCEIFKNGEKVASEESKDRLIVDESKQKITLDNPDSQWKTYIFKIINKKQSTDYESVKKDFVINKDSYYYHVETVNKNGTV
jgi:hypothetical protein